MEGTGVYSSDGGKRKQLEKVGSLLGETAPAAEMEEVGDEGVDRLVDSRDFQQQSKALDKLTDHVEDRQHSIPSVSRRFVYL